MAKCNLCNYVVVTNNTTTLYAIRVASSSARQGGQVYLVHAAATQVIDVFPFSRHGGGVVVVQRVLLGLADQFAGQIQKELLHVVRFFGGGLQVQHALCLRELLRSLPMDFSLFGQVDLIPCEQQQQ